MFTPVAVAIASSSPSTGFIPLIQGIGTAGLVKGAGKRRWRGPLLSGLLYTNHRRDIMYELESENWYKAVAEGRESGASDRARKDAKLLSFIDAITRSQQLLTGALMCESDELYNRLITEAKEISTKHNFTEDLRQAIYDFAVENAS